MKKWLDSGLFHPPAEGSAEENYSIAIPPPNVTGVLHMGHALNNTIQDCLARRHRQLGRRTKWILGTDHAGIATQTQVERALEREGTSRESSDASRSCSACGSGASSTAARSSSSSSASGRRLTMPRSVSRSTRRTPQAVLKVFVALYEKGYIYRDRYMVNWDPGSGSAISDLEVEPREVTDTLYYIDYPLASGSGAITVATVRPETMLADTAIAVHPEDERYRRLIGEKAILPLVGRKLRIIADDYVKPEFGTGALKITPAHDPNDFEIGRRHGLGQPQVIGEDGRITAEAPDALRRPAHRRGPAGGGRRARSIGTARPHRVTDPHRSLLAPLGRADRAADLVAVVHGHGRARQAGDRGRQPVGGCDFTPQTRRACTWTGWRTSGPGASPASSGGGTGFRCGTAALRPMSGPRRHAGRGGPAIPTCSTPGSRARCGRSRPSAGQMRPATWQRSIPPTRWSPAATSSFCGWRG